MKRLPKESCRAFALRLRRPWLLTMLKATALACLATTAAGYYQPYYYKNRSPIRHRPGVGSVGLTSYNGQRASGGLDASEAYNSPMAKSAAARAAARYGAATGIRQDHGARGAAISSVRDYYAGRDYYGGRSGSRYDRYDRYGSDRYDPSSYGQDDFSPYGRRNYGPRRDDYGIGFRDLSRPSSYGRRDQFGPSYGFRDESYGPQFFEYGRPGQYGRREDYGIGFRDAYGGECDDFGCYDDMPGMGVRGMGMRGGMDVRGGMGMPYDGRRGRYDDYGY